MTAVRSVLRGALPRVVAVALAVLAAPGPARGDAEPSPASAADAAAPAIVDPAVQPAAAVAPEPDDLGMPLPLSGPAASGAGRPARSPAPRADWTLLAGVAAAFAVLAGWRIQARRRPRGLPADVLEVLGGAPLGGQHAVRVVRFGPRTLLVGVSPAGCQLLATIDDAQATERIASACLGGGGAPPVRRSSAAARRSAGPAAPGDAS